MTKATGLVKSVRRVVWRIQKGREFSVKELYRAHPHLAVESVYPLKSIARALGWLVREGEVVMLGRIKLPGDEFKSQVYVRPQVVQPPAKTPGARLEAEPGERVRIEQRPGGVRRVSFGMGWKPYREPSTKRPWTGYQSALARIA